MTAAHPHIEFLGTSSSPIHLMRDLQTYEGPVQQVDLVDQSLSRWTVHRTLDKLMERDWIVRVEDEYALTVAGMLVLRKYSEFVDVADRDTFEFLANSSCRVQILQDLCPGPAGLSELAAPLSEANSTIMRCLRELKERQWIHQPEDHRYTLTPTGEQITNAYETLMISAKWITEYATLVNHLGSIGDDFPIGGFAAGETVTVRTSPINREAVLIHYGNRLDDPSPLRIRGISPIISVFLNSMHRPLLDDGIEIDLLIDDAVLDVTRTSYAETLREAGQTETLQLYLCPDRLEFGLAIMEFEEYKRMFLFAYDNRGNLHACIDSVANDVIEWATSLYEDYREAARPLETGELTSFI
jgi:predicted transcriptional regulator